MSMCETIKVVRKNHPDGFTEINLSDFDKSKDTEYKVKAVKSPTKSKNIKS